jgi:hypothetical protein
VLETPITIRSELSIIIIVIHNDGKARKEIGRYSSQAGRVQRGVRPKLRPVLSIVGTRNSSLAGLLERLFSADEGELGCADLSNRAAANWGWPNRRVAPTPWAILRRLQLFRIDFPDRCIRALKRYASTVLAFLGLLNLMCGGEGLPASLRSRPVNIRTSPSRPLAQTGPPP